jgi:hypothetical protein
VVHRRADRWGVPTRSPGSCGQAVSGSVRAKPTPTVTVTFEGRGEETEVTLRHLNLPDDELGRQTEWGWAHILASVAEVLAQQSASP